MYRKASRNKSIRSTNSLFPCRWARLTVKNHVPPVCQARRYSVIEHLSSQALSSRMMRFPRGCGVHHILRHYACLGTRSVSIVLPTESHCLRANRTRSPRFPADRSRQLLPSPGAIFNILEDFPLQFWYDPNTNHNEEAWLCLRGSIPHLL